MRLRSAIAMFSLVLALPTVAGTTEIRLRHPSGTQADLDRDKYECYREAMTVPQVSMPAGPPPRYPTGGGFSAGYEYGRAVRDYNAAIAHAEEQRVAQDRLFMMCLRARGWAPVER